MNNKPESELPWVYDARLKQITFGEHYGVTEAKQVSEEDAAYIVHACNAYPELIEFLNDCKMFLECEDKPLELIEDINFFLKELGEWNQ